MLPTRIRVHTFVAIITAAAAAAMAIAYSAREAFPGWWPIATFVLLATVLEAALKTRLRIAGLGSIAFVVHLSSALLFGAFWGATITGAAMLLANLARKAQPLKAVFNVSQIIVALLSGALLYQVLGGQLPPSYLGVDSVLSSPAVQRDLGLFFIFAATYFIVNSVAVSMAVALSSDRSFREVWNLNFRGVLGYDIAASALAIIMAWLYSRLDQSVGFGSVGVILLVLPMMAVRHVYALYRQLQESGQELLQVMVKAIEARDPYTSGHSVRVSRLSRTIAAELGLSATVIEQIETAALLHDVGKIHEEFAPLLRKEARLSEAETALMQTHAAKSAELVGIITKFRASVQPAVRHHHERWDGKGYPDGIGAEEIPIGSRVILIADTIDAMTTDRPYRPRLDLDQVIAELHRCSGTQFDPTIVAVTVSSVAVRRLILEPLSPASETNPAAASRRGRRLWKAHGV
jgi:HD-GYP domain-containing protein (c-di-GMP phosphodiesterase class II)